MLKTKTSVSKVVFATTSNQTLFTVTLSKAIRRNPGGFFLILVWRKAQAVKMMLGLFHMMCEKETNPIHPCLKSSKNSR